MGGQRELYERPQITPGQTGAQFLDDVVTLGLRALSDKALFWTVTLGALALWSFVAARPEFWRLIAVGGYTVGIFLPMLLKRH